MKSFDLSLSVEKYFFIKELLFLTCSDIGVDGLLSSSSRRSYSRLSTCAKLIVSCIGFVVSFEESNAKENELGKMSCLENVFYLALKPLKDGTPAVCE